MQTLLIWSPRGDMDNYAILIRGKKTSWTTMQFNYGLVQMWKPINCTILYIHICVEYDVYISMFACHMSYNIFKWVKCFYVPNTITSQTAQICGRLVVCCSLVKPDQWPSQAAASEPETPLLAIHIGKRNVWISVEWWEKSWKSK